METNKEFVRERVVVLEGVQSSGEYVLPDYQGDVRKLLYSRATAVSSGKYHNGDALECVGIVNYDVVYLDNEGRITPVSFTTDFDTSIRCSDEGYVDSHVGVRVTNFALRLMGPRKFSAKAALECECLVGELSSYEVSGDAFESGNMEMSTATVSVATGAYGAGDEVELAEEMVHLEGAIVDEVEVLMLTAEPRAVSVSATDGGAELRCEIVLSMLLKNGSDAPYTLERTLDYSGSVNSESLDEAMSLSGAVEIVSVRSDVNAIEDGVSVVASILAVPTVNAVGNLPVRLIKDCYSTSRGVSTEQGEFAYTEHLGSRTVSEKLSGEISREAVGAEEIRNIFFSTAVPKVEGAEILGNILKIRGTVRFSGIACEVNEEGVASYSPIKLELPYEHNVNYDLQIPDSARSRVTMTATAAKIDLDGANLYPQCTLTSHSALSVERRESCIQTASLTDEMYESDPSVVRVYYPEVGESLFEVAKKFHTTVLSVAKDNELAASVFSAQDSPDGLEGIHCLIIK